MISSKARFAWILTQFDIFSDFEPLLGSQSGTKQVFPSSPTRLESLVPLNEVHILTTRQSLSCGKGMIRGGAEKSRPLKSENCLGNISRA